MLISVEIFLIDVLPPSHGRKCLNTISDLIKYVTSKLKQKSDCKPQKSHVHLWTNS